MKILFLFPHFLSPGGAANVVLQFAKALRYRYYKVVILCADVSEEFRFNNPDLTFQQLKIPTSNSIRYWLFFLYWQVKINKQIKFYDDYILFTHVLPSNWWAWLYKRRNGDAKIVWYCNEPSAFIHSKTWINAIPVTLVRWAAKLFNPFLRRIDKTLEKENDIVICNSKFTKAEYKRIYGRNADAVIYPPCILKDVPINRRKESYILTVGRLSKFKNVNVLIKAYETIIKDLPDSKLVIVGDGEDKENLIQLTAELGITDFVSFEGKVNDEQLANIYRKAKITVICSRDEPFGLVPIESMIYSTPVIAHNSGGPKETIVPDLTGFLYNNEDELASLIKQFFEMDSDRYFEMQQNCVREVIKYDISNSVAQLLSVLQELDDSN